MSYKNLEELPSTTLAARDHKMQQRSSDVSQLFKDGVAYADKPESIMMAEARVAAKGPGKLSPTEYFRYRLFEHDKSERKEFISDRLHWPIHDICNDVEENSATENKLECTRILEKNNIPTIPVVCMFDASGGEYGSTPCISDSEQLAEFLRTTQFPIFAKPNDLLGSFGAMKITSFDGEQVEANGELVDVNIFLDVWIAGVVYMVQPFIENNKEIAEFTESLATIRTVNFVDEQGVRLSNAVYKFPAAGNIADNFWRKGNLVADIDVETGTIVRTVSGIGPYQEIHATHPETGHQLEGRQLPYWEKLCSINETCAKLFKNLTYQTLDIALTESGPVVVEVNSGGSFDLPQVASGKGFLNKENKKFFESCGVNFRKWKAKDFGIEF